MCLAIYKPSGVIIPKENLVNGFDANKDGAGMSFNADGKLVVKKGYFDFDSFYEEYQKNEERQMLIHFRWATHGKKNEFNCHPWVIADGDYQVSIIHNGVISIDTSEEMSDTGHFVHGWMAPLIKKHSRKLVFDPVFKAIVEDFVGAGNKLVMLDNHGKTTIYNEKMGDWDDGAWYSNTGYKSYGRSYCAGGWCDEDDYWSGRGARWGTDGSGTWRRQQLAEKTERQDELDAIIANENEEEKRLLAEEEAEHQETIDEMAEDYLEELEESDPAVHAVAVKEIAGLEAGGMDRAEAIRLVLG